MAERFEETIWGRLAAVLKQELGCRLSLPTDAVDEIARECIDRLVDDFGGEQAYLPRLIGHKFKKVYAQIVQEFNGNNYKDLAKKYGRSERRIRKIIHDHSKLKGSADLFARHCPAGGMPLR